MTYKSPVQPLCRYCGKAIAKHTTGAWFGRLTANHLTGDYREKPTTMEEASKLIGRQVVSVRKDDDGTLFSATVWDGQTYRDEFFCADKHARMMGEKAAKMGYRMPAYDQAMLASKEKA